MRKIIFFSLLSLFTFNVKAESEMPLFIPMRDKIFNNFSDCVPQKQKYYNRTGAATQEIIGKENTDCIFEYCDNEYTDGYLIKCKFNEKVLNKITEKISNFNGDGYLIKSEILNDASICKSTGQKTCKSERGIRVLIE